MTDPPTPKCFVFFIIGQHNIFVVKCKKNHHFYILFPFIHQVIHQCHENPPSNWPEGAYALMGRQDLSAQAKLREKKERVVREPVRKQKVRNQVELWAIYSDKITVWKKNKAAISFTFDLHCKATAACSLFRIVVLFDEGRSVGIFFKLIF